MLEMETHAKTLVNIGLIVSTIPFQVAFGYKNPCSFQSFFLLRTELQHYLSKFPYGK